MSAIEQHLRECGDGEDFHITNDDRIKLVEILACVCSVLRSGKLWFNEPDAKINQDHADFCELMSRRFANMKIEREQ